jgi:hypothetical protein
MTIFLHPKFLERVVALSENTGTLVSFPKGVVIDFGRETIGIRNRVNTNVLAYLGSGGSSVYSLGNHADAEQNADYLKIVRTYVGANVAYCYQRYERRESGSTLGKAFKEKQVRKDLWAQRFSGKRGSVLPWVTLA